MKSAHYQTILLIFLVALLIPTQTASAASKPCNYIVYVIPRLSGLNFCMSLDCNANDVYRSIVNDMIRRAIPTLTPRYGHALVGYDRWARIATYYTGGQLVVKIKAQPDTRDCKKAHMKVDQYATWIYWATR